MHRFVAAFVAVIAVLVATTRMVAAGDVVSGDGLRSAITGKTVHISTEVGTVPVTFRADGTVTGRASGIVTYAIAASDQGRWWISGDRLCSQWGQWFKGAAQCFT